MIATTLYIDTGKSAVSNPVLSAANTNPDDGQLVFTAGDVVKLNLIFVNGGSVDTDYAVTGSQSSSYYVAVGTLAGTTPYTSTRAFFISQSYGVTGSLSFTGTITGSFGSNDYIEPYMQVSVTTPSGSSNKRTLMLKKIRVYDAVDL